MDADDDAYFFCCNVCRKYYAFRHDDNNTIEKEDVVIGCQNITRKMGGIWCETCQRARVN